MFYLFQSSPGVTLSFWQLAILGVITASGGYAASWFNRKRPSTIKVGDDKIAAEVHKLEIQNVKDLWSQLTAMREESESALAEQRKRAEEHRKQHDFDREQIRVAEINGTVARKAMHAALKEMGRCTFAIHLRDEAIKEWESVNRCNEDLLTANKVKFEKAKIDQVPVFEQVEYEDIVNFQALVLPETGNLRT